MAIFLLLLFVGGYPAVPAGAQAPSEAEPPGPPPATPPPPPAPVPEERPFVPPLPPPPSQTRLPAPFQEPALVPGGPVLEFHPTLTFSEEYTDNFTIASTGRTENFRSTLRAGFNLLINDPKTRGSVSSSIGASRDSADGRGAYSLFPSITGSVRHTVNPRLSLTLTDTFTRSDEASQADTGGLRRERQTFVANTFSASVDWLLDLLATQTYYRVSTFFGAADTTSQILGTNASTRLGPLMTLRLGYEFTKRETETTTPATGETSTETIGHRVLGSLSRQLGQWTQVGVSSSYSLLLSDPGDSRIWNVSLFSTYGTPAGLSLSGSLGYGLIDSDRGSALQSLSTNSSASYRFAWATVSLTLFQDFRQTADEGEDFGIVVTRGMTGTFTYQLTPFIDTSLRAAYSRNESTGTGNSASDRATATFTAGAGLNWQLLRWLRMTLDLTHTDRSSDTSTRLTTGGSTTPRTTAPADDSKENRASLTLAATF